jgi:Big-like domain-containing protein
MAGQLEDDLIPLASAFAGVANRYAYCSPTAPMDSQLDRRRRRFVVPVAACSLLTLAAVDCGTSPGRPTTEPEQQSLSFPVIVPVGSTCGSGTSAIYYVWGLSNQVRDAHASPLAATVRVGETVRMSLDFEGCGSNRSEVWTSTNSSVAAVTQDGQLSAVARLTGLVPGETRIFVEFEGPDRQRHRTYPAYCPSSVYVCVSPRTPIAVVRVVTQ